MENYKNDMLTPGLVQEFGSALLFGEDNALLEMVTLALVDMGISSASRKNELCGETLSIPSPNIIIIDCSQPGDERQSDAVSVDQSEIIPVILLSFYTLLELNFCPKFIRCFWTNLSR